MDFGLFYYCQGRGVPHDQAYAEMLEQIALAEALGFGECWFAEHHFERRGVPTYCCAVSFAEIWAGVRPGEEAVVGAQRGRRAPRGRVSVSLLTIARGADRGRAGRGRGQHGRPSPVDGQPAPLSDDRPHLPEG